MAFSDHADDENSTDVSLLQRVRNNDQDAWRRLVRVYSPLVYQWCRRAGLAPENAADAMQETFLAVARSLHRFRREHPKDSFRGWLWTIARNKTRDGFRRQRNDAEAAGGTSAHRRVQALSDPFAAENSESNASEECSALLRALELIRPDFEQRTWQAFWGMAVEDRAAADLAEELGMKERSVRQAKYRVLQRLRADLQDLID
ncbi:MAG: sigma-70 family RNA polymerase sigma factor [Planctomycetales bacterium]